MYVGLGAHERTHVHADALKGQKRALDCLQLLLQAGARHLLWVLEAKGFWQKQQGLLSSEPSLKPYASVYQLSGSLRSRGSPSVFIVHTVSQPF